MAKKQIPYSTRELLATGPQPTRKGRELDEIAFPLGGLGTGAVSLGGWGQLRDWELMNRPAKGFGNDMAFFTLRAQAGGDAPVVRVVQGHAGSDHIGGGHSAARGSGQGLPHFHRASFTGSYPFAHVKFRDKDLPLKVDLEALNPFIPLNDKDSGIPVAILRYTVKNTGKQTLSVSLMGNLTNIVGHPDGEGRVSKVRSARGLKGFYGTTSKHAEDSPAFGSMALTTPWEDTDVWLQNPDRSGGLAKFWESVAWAADFPPTAKHNSDTGAVCAHAKLKPGAAVTIPFFITWHFPVFEHWRPKSDSGCAATWRNYYASQWKDAWDVAAYTAKELERLLTETRQFHDSLFASTLPTHVLDAVSSQLSILKSTTCLRLEDGTFYGFEGCSNTQGCCEGSCTHVWNYAQALPYLFPALQRSMREADYVNSMEDDGYVTFRMPLPLGTKAEPGFHPAADGQMGTVLQVYREWQVSGDDDWLRRIWPLTKKALEFAWKYWDADKDGVMEGMQHNTYDIEFYGPNTMMGSLYLGALRAGEEIARYLGEEAKADEYRTIFQSGSAWMDEHLFNGEYYEQIVEPEAHLAWPDRQRELAEKHGKDDKFTTWPKWQFGKGCASDQLLGQWYGAMLDLGHFFDRRKVRKALRSIFKHNWRADLTDFPGIFRLYALNDEPGLLIATWPRGERPGHAFYFADEVWCGIEYQVASHLIYEGFVEEGLLIVKGVRDRHTGERRNPWNEFECGHHYARSLASYGVLTALSGFHYSAPNQSLSFAPQVNEKDFTCFFSVASGWGTYRQKQKGGKVKVSLTLDYGALTLKELSAALSVADASKVAVRLAGETVQAAPSVCDQRLVVALDEPATIEAGQRLTIAG